MRTLLSSSVAEVTKIFGGDLAEEEKRIYADQVEREEAIGEGGSMCSTGRKEESCVKKKNVIL